MFVSSARLKSDASKAWDSRRVDLIDPDTEADVTFDEEQEEKYHELIELLLAAGYFRARVSTLSRFDKIVGGLSWCIISSNVELDVNIMYTGEMAIGKRIKLGENIVKVLRKMKCPYPLQSHQIQGLDCVKIFPILQWLVKKVIEHREETGDLVRAFSIMQFDKSFALPSEIPDLGKQQRSLEYQRDVNEVFKPKRKLKHSKASTSVDRETRVYSALLEYGKSFVSDSVDDGEFKEDDVAIKNTLERQMQRLAEEKKAEKDLEQRLRKGLVENKSRISVSKNVLGKIIENQSEELGQYEKEYVQKRESDLDGMRTDLLEESFKRNKAKLQGDIDETSTMLVETKKLVGATKNRIEELSADMKKIKAYNARLIAERDKLAVVETEDNKEVIDILKASISLVESLEEQETDFKESCRNQLSRLRAMIKAGEASASGELITQAERIKEAYEAEKKKAQIVREGYSERAREIHSMRRHINEVPQRAQLVQYEKRFLDVFEQIGLKLDETKKYYAGYNTLSETHNILVKEISLLTSIQENYSPLLKSGKKSRDKFSITVQQLVKNVQESMEKMEEKVADVKNEKDVVYKQFKELIDIQREYYKAVKEFKVEANKNQRLSSK